MSDEAEQARLWSDAWAFFERWYRNVVKEYVAIFKAERADFISIKAKEDEVDEDEIDNDDDDVREHMDEWLHQTIDGAEEVIYTGRARVVLLVSQNEDLYAEELGQAPPDVHAQAYWALRADVLEHVDL